MNKLLPLLTLATLSAGSAYAQFNLVQTKIQSPGGWRLVGITRNADASWIKPSTVKGDASSRSVEKISAHPDKATKLSETIVYIDCPKALQRQAFRLTPFAKSQPLVINQGSVWETIGKLICPTGTYGTAAPGRPAAPLR